MPAEKKTSEPFKNLYNEELYRQIADAFAAADRGFDKKRFLKLTLDGLAQRELMDRMRQLAIAAEATLSGDYRAKVAVLRDVAPKTKRGLGALSFCDFIARHGLDDFDFSMDALKFFTVLGSAEFAVRPFIQKDPARALAFMETWARDENEHVRRLASEGSRPRLPWGIRLTAIVENPDLTAPILERLKDDSSLYVRKSVANHLNDIAKDHSDWVLDRVGKWDRSNPGIDWIIHRALRTLVKQGNPRALAFFGADTGAAKDIKVSDFSASPARPKLGDTLHLSATLRNRDKKTLPLVIDYVLHYARATGKSSAKVFKWTKISLAPDAEATVKKNQVLRDFSIRKHHAGRHTVELQVNGRRLAKAAFDLVVPSAKRPGRSR